MRGPIHLTAKIWKSDKAKGLWLMMNTYQHELSGNTAESNGQPDTGDMPNTGQQSLFTATQDAYQRDLFAQIGDRSLPPSRGETPGAGQGGLSSLRSGSEPLDYLAKLKEEHRDYLARLEANRHEHAGEAMEESVPPSGDELPVVASQESFSAVYDAASQVPLGETTEERGQPVADKTTSASKENLSRGSLRLEQLDYLAQLEAEHQARLAQLEADRQKSLDGVAEVNTQPVLSEMPVAVPEKSVFAAPDAVAHEHVSETVEQSTQPVVSEIPVAVPIESFFAAPDAVEHEYVSETVEQNSQPVVSEMPVAVPEESFFAAPDAVANEHVSETVDQSAQPVVSVMPVAVPEQSVAAAPDAVEHEHVSETAEQNTQPVVSEMPVANPVEIFFAALDAVEHEHVSETVEQSAQPVLSEVPIAVPEVSVTAAPDAVADQHVIETVEQSAQPVISQMPVANPVESIFAAPDVVPQERSDMSLRTEQLDYLTKLEAQHQEYLAKAEAERQLRAEAIAGQPESIVIPPPPAAELPPVDFPAPGQPVPSIELLPPVAQDVPAESARPASNAAVMIVVIGIIMGVLFGGVIAAITWKATKPAATPAAVVADPNISRDPRDLGSVDSGAAGLSGHLTTKWDGKLNYTFVITPDDPSRQAEFALMVSNPPRPLSMNIELKNSYGFILCSREAVLKYAAGNLAAGRKAQGNSSAPLAVDEAAREKDNDVFQNQTGADGKLASISAQGEIPCPAQAYANLAYWSFTPNYPDMSEQNQLLQDKLNSAAAATPRHAVRKWPKTAKSR